MVLGDRDRKFPFIKTEQREQEHLLFYLTFEYE